MNANVSFGALGSNITAPTMATFATAGVIFGATGSITAIQQIILPGGGGFGAVMASGFFQRYKPRYEVHESWRRVKRVKA